MIQISDAAQSHFRKLIEREAIPGLGVRLSALNPGTQRADVRLEFAEPDELNGDEWVVDCAGFSLWLDAPSVPWLEGAQIDYETNPTGGQLQIRAPRIKGVVPGADAPLAERVQWIIDNEINPQLAMHKGNVNLAGVDADGVVRLNFGGGCHGCSMVDITLKQGVEKTLLMKVPGVTRVMDVTDHDSGANPYASRGSKSAPAGASPYSQA
ncbi:NfuA family Fe-S biogenesis protein [Thermomonas sp.]|uniref:NfuA family Fe-S biogenesis protein n=1 Tax=Thermomonas sp. TaxID=1971895 RepID=UPI001D274B39|nr:NfuA family Fe-S biogenesis protein [Thermomonas sp.]MBZ0088619.1 NfuA family Fe-S biogenesis protein [Thermomonas sp.]MCO5054315.1 NfuA family Fe-S biogenesis protein [Thermomonas sp.]HRO64052.1 NfuA family Fe-S biogenesis protein [Thermomonas sp.]